MDDFDLHKIGLNAEFLADYLNQAGYYSMEQVEKFALFDDTSSYVPIRVNRALLTFISNQEPFCNLLI